MIDTYKFNNDQCPDYFDELFCPVGENSVITRSSNKETTRNPKLIYVGPNTSNSFPSNLKFATSLNSFEHYIKEYFLKTLGNAEAESYSYT